MLHHGTPENAHQELGHSRRRTLTMNWDGLAGEDDDDDHFFETYERVSSAAPFDLANSSGEDDDFEDSRMSFASTVSSIQTHRSETNSKTVEATTIAAPTTVNPVAAAIPAAFSYDMWLAAPGSITERRKRLLFGMGLNENKESMKITSVKLELPVSEKLEMPEDTNSESKSTPIPETSSAPVPVPETSSVSKEQKTEHSSNPAILVQSIPAVLVRSHSDGEINSFSMQKSRKEDLIGNASKQRLTRTVSGVAAKRGQVRLNADFIKIAGKEASVAQRSNRPDESLSRANPDSGVGFFVIKNLDTGTGFVVEEEDGALNGLSDLRTGKQLTLEEFEKSVGYSPVVKEVMRRSNWENHGGDGSGGGERKLNGHSYISRSLRLSKKKGFSLLRNLRGVASGFYGGERGKEMPVQFAPPSPQAAADPKPAKNEWIKVQQSGKSGKDISALYMCQEFQAHEGCIWTIKFSFDGRFLASAGEDRVIHVWEVQECEVLSTKPEEGNLTPAHPSRLESPSFGSEKKKFGKFGSRKENKIPKYVRVPETVFALSEKPYCSFEGHTDDVLDLSWSKSQLLLSSSMDKSVRLWNLEHKTCLKVFVHNDYVTCIQFNPIDDDYFMSGSLDSKVRIWNVSDRFVVDWIDVHEMITAVTYTPDGQTAFVGTHKGGCRTYRTEGCKLSPINVIELRRKKKSHLRKVTGFQFVPGNPSEVLVTSADSWIKIVDGTEVVQKFKGFRNANSQIAGSFTSDGRYIISASEDSQVYVWRHEDTKQVSSGKGTKMHVTRAHEHFPCKDVSIAIPWPCTIKGGPSPTTIKSKRYSIRNLASHPFSASSSPRNDGNQIAASSKKMLPPLPKKGTINLAIENVDSPIKGEDPEANSQGEFGFGGSFTSRSCSIGCSDSPSNLSSSGSIGHSDSSPSVSSSSACPFSSLSLDSSHVATTTHSSAWGLVIVTAGFGGEIRCYQNFGLPRRMSRLHPIP